MPPQAGTTDPNVSGHGGAMPPKAVTTTPNRSDREAERVTPSENSHAVKNATPVDNHHRREDGRSHRGPSRDRNERGGSQDELDCIRKEYTRSESKKRRDRRSGSRKRGDDTPRKEVTHEDGCGDYPWSREISPAKKLNKLAEQKKDLTWKRDRSHGSSRSPSHDRSSRGGSRGRDSQGTSTETTDVATPNPKAPRNVRYRGAKKKSSQRTKFGHKDSDTGSDTSEDSESSVCSWDTPLDRRALPPLPPGHCAPTLSPLKRRKSIDSWATPRPLDCDRPERHASAAGHRDPGIQPYRVGPGVY